MKMTEEVFKTGLTTMAGKKINKLFDDFTKEKYNMTEGESRHTSLKKGKKNISVKCSRPILKTKKEKYLEKLLNTKKLMSIKEIEKTKFLCNFQQIRLAESDDFYCYLLFDEVIKLMKISKSKLQSDKKLNYLGYQHYKNAGNEGQLFITGNNVKHFLNTYCIKDYSHPEVFEFARSK